MRSRPNRCDPVRVLAVALVGLVAAGCSDAVYFCEIDAVCTMGRGSPGTCEPNGLCSFPDADCDSGRRYGEHAGSRSEQCVRDEDDDAALDDDMGASPAPSGHESTGEEVSGGTLTLDEDDGSDDGAATTPTAAALQGASSSDDATGGGGPSDSGTDDGPQPAPPYGECMMGMGCLADESCTGSVTPKHTCFTKCEDVAECPAHPEGAEVACLFPPNYAFGTCLIVCDLIADPTCPGTMSCFDLGPGYPDACGFG